MGKLTDGYKEQRVIRIINTEDYTLLLTRTDRLYRIKLYVPLEEDIQYYIEADNTLGYYHGNDKRSKNGMGIRVEEIFDKTKYLVHII